MTLEELLRSANDPLADKLPPSYRLAMTAYAAKLGDKMLVHMIQLLLMEATWRISDWTPGMSEPSDEVLNHGIQRVLNLISESLKVELNGNTD